MPRGRKETKNWNDSEILLLKTIYDETPKDELEKIFSLEFSLISAKAKRIGLKSKRKFYTRRKKCNDNFFKEYTIRSSYLAGYIIADGHLPKNRISQIQFGAAEEDVEQLNKMKEWLCPTANLYRYIKNLNDKDFVQYKFAISSLDLRSDLEKNFNINYTDKVNHTNSFPNLPSLDLELAFICGVIDGDGSITYRNDGYKYLRIDIYGSSDLIQGIQRVLSRFNIEINIQKQKCKNINLHHINLNGKKAERFFDIIKKVDGLIDILMKRKWDKINGYKLPISSQ